MKDKPELSRQIVCVCMCEGAGEGGKGERGSGNGHAASKDIHLKETVCV